MPEAIEIQLKKGVLGLCVLALLSRGDSYAYEIASRLTRDIDMGEGTIYPLMRRMQSDGLVETYLVESASGPSRKYYRLTDAGRSAFAEQKTDWTTFVRAVDDILSADTNPGSSGMTRAEFITRLRRGLKGLSTSTVDEIVADHEAHFDEAMAQGRAEAEVAAALGDPSRLAREVRLEAGLKRWDEEKNPSAAAGALFALLGLGAIDILILLPILMGVIGTLFGVLVAVIAGFFVGGVVFVAGPFMDAPGGPIAALLGGLGVMAISTTGGALLAVVSIWLMNLLVWYGRLHYRLLKPALESSSEV